MKLVSIFYKDFGPFDQAFTECIQGETPEDIIGASAIILHGGADIHPSLYKEGRSSLSGAGTKPSVRDMVEWNALQLAIKHGVPIIGICRGAQMLCAAAGGRLFQHVDNHGGGNGHTVETIEGTTLFVNSVHHQMQDPRGTNHETIAWCGNRSQRYYHVEETDTPPIDYEMVYYPDIKGIAIQWHPEWLPYNCEANQYVVNFVKKVVTNDCNVAC